MYGRVKRKPIKNVEIKLCPPQEKPTIGKLCPVEVLVCPQQAYYIKYVLFELINERTDKRAPTDRITSRSGYIYRFNVEKAIETLNGDNKYTFQLRIPVHKEASRNDKFICIKWQIGLEVIMTVNEDDKELLSACAPAFEVEVV